MCRVCHEPIGRENDDHGSRGYLEREEREREGREEQDASRRQESVGGGQRGFGVGGGQ